MGTGFWPQVPRGLNGRRRVSRNGGPSGASYSRAVPLGAGIRRSSAILIDSLGRARGRSSPICRRVRHGQAEFLPIPLPSAQRGVAPLPQPQFRTAKRKTKEAPLPASTPPGREVRLFFSEIRPEPTCRGWGGSGSVVLPGSGVFPPSLGFPPPPLALPYFFVLREPAEIIKVLLHPTSLQNTNKHQGNSYNREAETTRTSKLTM